MRTSLLLLISMLSLCQNTRAQKENWTFSDRTGIKGVQFSFGGVQTLNKQDVFHFNQHFSPTPAAGESIINTTIGAKQNWNAQVQLEIVYAPFRFNSNKLLKNLELIAGISHRGMYQEYITEIKRNETNQNYDSERIYYLLENSSDFLNLKTVFNIPIKPGIAGYGTLGYGFGISSGSELTETSRFSSSYYLHNQSNGETSWQTGPVSESLVMENRYHTSVYRQESLSLGLKIYVSCRVNLNFEYAFHFAQYVDRQSFTSSINQHGPQFGFRFKFNPPEPLSPEDKEKLKDAFW